MLGLSSLPTGLLSLGSPGGMAASFETVTVFAQSLLAQAADPTAQLLTGVGDDGAVGDDTGEGFTPAKFINLAITFAVLILPFVIGPFIAKRLRMPTYGMRISFILLALIGSIAVLAAKRPGQGVDLRGGTILVYEIDPSKMGASNDVSSEDLIKPLTERINPSGTQEIVIRPYGDNQIEIIVPETSPAEVRRLKKKIEEAGILRFAIVANRADHQGLINRAVAMAQDPDRKTSTDILDSQGRRIGLWAEVDRESASVNVKRPLRVGVGGAILRNASTGDLVDLPPSLFQGKFDETLEKIAQYVDDQGMQALEILMITDPRLPITGEDLDFAFSTIDQRGAPAVGFNLTDAGGRKFGVLTSKNGPVGSRKRQLGIVLDDKLLSAPTINGTINDQGTITGSFTSQEVDDLVSVLRAGQLPAAVTKQPISENEIGATLGRDTIRKGVIAITVSLLLVLAFILVYYRFSGLIACVALVLNLALILATMVLINQPLTLPGLAGLVLTVGMSVDANVLIFERIREETRKKAADRMAVRNGFAKATVTIIDANLTTLITAIVLYAIGTDQIRGFAVTLILGILFSMFTAIYVSRTLFDLAERHGKLSLAMSDGVNRLRTRIAGADGFDFIGKGRIALLVSSVLIAIGLVATFTRGRSIFDIDFNGGTSVQFQLAQSASDDAVREALNPIMVRDGQEIPFTVNAVSMTDVPEGAAFKVDSGIEKVDDLKSAVIKAFADKPDLNLVIGNLEIEPDGQVRQNTSRSAVRLVSMQAAVQTESEGETDVDIDGVAIDGVDANAVDADADDADNVGVIDAATGPARVTRVLDYGGSGVSGVINGATLTDQIVTAAEALDVELNVRNLSLKPLGENVDDWSRESSLKFARWRVGLPLDAAAADAVLDRVQDSVNNEPVWVGSSEIGSRVAGEMIGRATAAFLASLLCIVGYIWFRFQRVIYGVAAVAALIHDVLVTVGAIAVSFWLADFLGVIGITPFKISLTVVAALLTIVGYSLNDTIVVFDRIRETKGKAPRLTGKMINDSINSTLSRTLLTSITTLIVVLLLYFFGGSGIHAFAFALVVGVLVGTYSSVFVASPVLHWLVSRSDKAVAKPTN